MIETKPKSSTKGVEFDLINTFLSNETNETSFARQISVIQTKKYICEIKLNTDKNERNSKFRAKQAKNKAK